MLLCVVMVKGSFSSFYFSFLCVQVVGVMVVGGGREGVVTVVFTAA